MVSLATVHALADMLRRAARLEEENRALRAEVARLRVDREALRTELELLRHGLAWIEGERK